MQIFDLTEDPEPGDTRDNLALAVDDLRHTMEDMMAFFMGMSARVSL